MHRCKKSLAAVAIRKAKTGDFDFVFRLMTEALEPFYDGDHQAHAQRILLRISIITSILSGSFHSGNTCLLQKLIIILLE